MGCDDGLDKRLKEKIHYIGKYFYVDALSLQTNFTQTLIVKLILLFFVIIYLLCLEEHIVKSAEPDR